MQIHKNRTKVLIWSLISFAITMSVCGSVIATWELIKPSVATREKRIWGRCYRDLQAKPLTIGIAIGAPDEEYNPLTAYRLSVTQTIKHRS